MKMKSLDGRALAVFITLVVGAALTRLIPGRPVDFAPFDAVGLFAGAYVTRRWAWGFPVAAMLLADSLIGFYNPVVMMFVYAGFGASGVIGALFLKENRSALKIGACAFGSGTAFFLFSDFGLWVAGYYPRTLAGLIACYVNALPFLRNTYAGSLFYSGVLFGAMALATHYMPQQQGVTA